MKWTADGYFRVETDKDYGSFPAGGKLDRYERRLPNPGG